MALNFSMFNKLKDPSKKISDNAKQTTICCLANVYNILVESLLFCAFFWARMIVHSSLFSYYLIAYDNLLAKQLIEASTSVVQPCSQRPVVHTGVRNTGNHVCQEFAIQGTKSVETAARAVHQPNPTHLPHLCLI